MHTTQVIHIRNKRGTQDEVYIGRGGPFGNPVIKHKPCPICGKIHRDNGSTLPCYRQYLHERMRNEAGFREKVAALLGMTLVCFCKPAPCHGDVLAEETEKMFAFRESTYE